MNRFTNKTVVVTGSTGALGKTLVRRFAEEGANTVATGRENIEEVAAELPGNALGVTLDVTSEADWARVVQTAEDRFGPIDVLVNNAAYLHVGTTESIPIADWHQVMETNLTGAFLGIRAAAPSMRKAGGGSIVNINSIAGLAAAPGLVAYSSSKWALRALMRAAAAELAPDKIRVNAVHDGIIDTPLAYGADGQELVPVGHFPIPRQASTDEIVASDDASLSTGSEIVDDGGFLLGPIQHRRLQRVTSRRGETI